MHEDQSDLHGPSTLHFEDAVQDLSFIIMKIKKLYFGITVKQQLTSHKLKYKCTLTPQKQNFRPPYISDVDANNSLARTRLAKPVQSQNKQTKPQVNNLNRIWGYYIACMAARHIIKQQFILNHSNAETQNNNVLT